MVPGLQLTRLEREAVWESRVVISCRSVTSGVHQGSTLGPKLSDIFINDLDDGAEGTLSKFADDTELEGEADTPDGCDVTQRDFDSPLGDISSDRLEKWAGRNLMPFKKESTKSYPGEE
ncbi:mitochondrial enolase superfamily member 1 [Grus japonensis]|uniref:Mitochondrial enolase superfamily member 1 n=1 Tax=Grus japonensis TaxID=30415 RepID=A0ABC9W0Y1_GRUJA